MAQFYLGKMYNDGWGVPQDYVQAYMWLDLAVRPGNIVVSKYGRVMGVLILGADPDNAKKLLSWEACGRVV